MPDRRILFVHAHPDDESIETGATMAKYAREGAYVCLVTCTRGEEGEVIPEDLRHLSGDALGEYRSGELTRACAALGVADQRYLGGAGRWRDSGMMGDPANDHPRCFWRADVDEAADALVRVVREVRPQVVVTYDDNGFYGHPDHIQAHRVAWRAVERSADPSYGEGEPWAPLRFYATAIPLSELSAEVGRGPFGRVGSVREFGFGVPDEQVSTRIDAVPYLPAKVAAMRFHGTQITLAPPYYALSNNVGLPLLDAEYYTLLAGDPGLPGEPGAYGRETDLFHPVA